MIASMGVEYVSGYWPLERRILLNIYFLSLVSGIQTWRTPPTPVQRLLPFEAAAPPWRASRAHAAEELALTHGRVSHQVRALEEYVGAPIFRVTASGRGAHARRSRLRRTRCEAGSRRSRRPPSSLRHAPRRPAHRERAAVIASRCIMRASSAAWTSIEIEW